MSETPGRLVRFEDLTRCAIGAVDGAIGDVEDVYFDDQSWTVRYLVVDTGGWLSGRQVLLSPHAIERLDAVGQRVVTRLSRRQVEESPPVDTAKPVSRQYESDLLGYYGYSPYWTGAYRWGPYMYPETVPLSTSPEAAPPPYPSRVAEEMAARERESADPHLRSARAVRGYSIQATDGGLGHVESYLLDDREWAIRYVVVDPRSWWPGEHVLVSPDWITAVDWNASKVHVDVTRETVRNAPPYRPEEMFEMFHRDLERELYAHHRRPGYWERRPEDWRRRAA